MAIETVSKDLVFAFPEWQVNTFSVDCTGRRAVLAVQKWMAVVSLEADQDAEKFSEPTALRKLARQNKYEIKALSWCPHPARQGLLASACQQKVELWDVKAERHPLLQSIKAHTRPVSDVGWSVINPHLLASCASDSFVQVWDTRDTKRPKTSFKAVAGASLVQWNRINENVIASAHDSDIRIWDMRKPTTASGYISAHMSRIHDLDWSYFHEKQLTTCSHDASIKFWDVSSPKEPMSTIKAGSQPLWRARNYPAGHAVAMVLVPAMHSGDSRVFLWGRSNVASPLHIFTGHSEAVLEVHWRRYRGGCDLVTWSKDRTLRVWGISEELRESLGGEASEQITIPESMPSQGSDPSLSLSMSLEGEGTETSLTPQLETDSILSSVRSLKEGGHSQSSLSASPTKSVSSMFQNDPQSSLTKSLSAQFYKGQSLEQEFKLLNLEGIPNLEIERLEASQRSCTVKVEQGGHLVRLGITFPAHYPNGAAPSFIFDKSSTIDMTVQQELNRVITDTANSYVKQNIPCLEHCLKKLSKGLESFMSRPHPPSKRPDFDISFGLLDDEHIPFPRTSGARFSVNGHLVCFYGPTSSDVATKPRSLDKMNAYKSSHIRSMVRGQSWRSGYLSSSLPKRGSSGANMDKLTASLFVGGDKTSSPFTNPVDIHDAISVLPIDLALAKAYSISSCDVRELCTANASAAALVGRMDLVQVWSIAALVADIDIEIPTTPDDGTPWPEHPFGRELIHSLFDHYAKLHDVQTLAMLACVFQEHCLQFDRKHKKHLPSHGNGHGNSNHLTAAVNRASMIDSSMQKKFHGYAPPTPTPTSTVSQERSPWHINSTSGPVTSPISGSWQEVSENDLMVHEVEDPAMEEQNIHEMKCRLLDPLLTRQCDEYRRAYANILYAWNLLDKRSEVLKYQVGKLAQSSKIKLRSLCHQCGELVEGPACTASHCFAFACSICNLSVRGSSTFCLNCGHGGHAKHMIEWFSKNSSCPAGCDCVCLESSGWT